MRRAGVLIGVTTALLTLAACGEPAETNAPIHLSGALNGVYHPGPPASCGTGTTTVLGQYGPNSTRDVGTMTVSDDGSVSFDVWKGPSFFGRGVAFRPGHGWDIDAQLHGPASETVTATGHLPC